MQQNKVNEINSYVPHQLVLYKIHHDQLGHSLIMVFISFLTLSQPFTPCTTHFMILKSPWYNRTGWLGIKHQLTYFMILKHPSVHSLLHAIVFTAQFMLIIDDLWKSRGLRSVSDYRHGLYIQVQACRYSAFVGGTVSTWARWRIPVNKGRKYIKNADQALTVRGEHADRIVGSPSW